LPGPGDFVRSAGAERSWFALARSPATNENNAGSSAGGDNHAGAAAGFEPRSAEPSKMHEGRLGGGDAEGDVGNYDEYDDYFAAEEVEAAEIMFEAFRATKVGLRVRCTSWMQQRSSIA
jgi:hypothetical protein